MSRRPARLRIGGSAAALLALAAGLSGCTSGPQPPRPVTGTSPVVTGTAPTVASAALADEVDVGAGTWRTTWRACFAPATDDEAVVGWEVQPVTAEGASPRVQGLPGGCVELAVGTGLGSPDDDPARTAALADAASLGYRARAVRSDGTVTPWTEPVAVGSIR